MAGKSQIKSKLKIIALLPWVKKKVYLNGPVHLLFFFFCQYRAGEGVDVLGRRGVGVGAGRQGLITGIYHKFDHAMLSKL